VAGWKQKPAVMMKQDNKEWRHQLWAWGREKLRWCRLRINNKLIIYLTKNNPSSFVYC